VTLTTTVAAFDVDGTITDRDCVVPFMRRVTGTRRIAGRLVARPDRMIPVLARRDRDQLKALAAAAAFRARCIDDLAAIGASFAQYVHDHWLRQDTVALLDGHRIAGDRVVLVSASFDIYLRPLGRLLGVDEVLATRLQARDGVATGALDGLNCRGPEKVRRLHEWLDTELDTAPDRGATAQNDAGSGRARARVVAYGDSVGDRELLADANEAHWVTLPRSARRARDRVAPGVGGAVE